MTLGPYLNDTRHKRPVLKFPSTFGWELKTRKVRNKRNNIKQRPVEQLLNVLTVTDHNRMNEIAC